MSLHLASNRTIFLSAIQMRGRRRDAGSAQMAALAGAGETPGHKANGSTEANAPDLTSSFVTS